MVTVKNGLSRARSNESGSELAIQDGSALRMEYTWITRGIPYYYYAPQSLASNEGVSELSKRIPFARTPKDHWIEH